MRPRFLKFDVLFYAPLGTNEMEIGSNQEEISDYISNNMLVKNDFIDVPTSLQIFRDKLFVADRYNKRVSIFSLGNKETNYIIISNKGNGYEFDTPVAVLVNKYGEIYILATITNKSTNKTRNIERNEEIVNKETEFKTSLPLSYIYKFSPSGEFVYFIGEDGIHSDPMPLPYRIDIDLFDNLYVYTSRFDDDYKNINVKRYSMSGELIFEFDTRYISKTNVSGDEAYLNFISDIYNLKNDERLIISSKSYLIRKGTTTYEAPNIFYNSIDVYSILKNSITRNLFKEAGVSKEIITVTYDDVVVLYSYDQRAKGVKFEFVDVSGEGFKKEVYYIPFLPPLYQTVGYWVDKKGEIYSIVVKDEKYFVVLKWKKRKSGF